MRTTLTIDDHLYRAVKRQAAGSGRTIRQFIEEALSKAVVEKQKPKPGFKLRWVTVKGPTRPGVDLADREALYELMEGRS